jgi:signal transduction histidine kinase
VKPERAGNPIQLVRGDRRAAGSRRSIRLAALRVPLVAKLIGANLAVVAVLTGAWIASGDAITGSVLLAIGGVVVLHVVAVLVALRPIRDLEDVVSRVWEGDFGARVDHSAIADDQVLRVGAMFNLLLDGLASDRERMRALAAEVIEVGDRERAMLARELHDSTAQHLAALLLQISAAARDCDDPVLRDRLLAARDSAQEITEEVRLLSHTVHPRVLDDLGLVAALQKLARDSSHGTGIDVEVAAPAVAPPLPQPVASTLYRVAQESVRNAIRHASPHKVRLAVELDADAARLEVLDDGCGFDLQEAQRRRPGMGLLSMRERVSLVDGTLDIRTAPGNGTTVTASIPLRPTPSRGAMR